MDQQELSALTEEAESGDMEAQYKLALEYDDDWSIDIVERESEAAKWFGKAAKQGHVDAQYRFGKYLWGGRSGLPADKEEGIRWLRKAAEAEHYGAVEDVRDYEELLEVVREITKKAAIETGTSHRKVTEEGYAVEEKEIHDLKDKLFDLLTHALSKILLNEKIPLDVVNAATGEIIIPANRKITNALLRKLVGVYDHVDIDPSPIRNKIREIIAQFETHFARVQSVLDNYRWRLLEKTPAYDLMLKLLQRANDGNAQAQHDVACSYYTGTALIEKDIQKAKTLFLAASEQGHIPSLAALGDCYADENDHAAAERCYRKAAKEGDPHGQFRVARLSSESDALRLLTLAAEQNHVQAQKELADRWANSGEAEENRMEAARWYSHAAEQGDAEAQRKLGDCFAKGWIVFCDPKNNRETYRSRQAVKWYRKAAEQGDVEARKRLGRCYAGGIGVAKNEVLAARWFCRAGMQGDPEAYEELGDLYAELGDESRAKRYYRKAGLKGWDLRHRLRGW